MKISIVTISFNQCAYLKDALDSVLDQGYPELDYIVVDPGSTDGSRELIMSYSKYLSRVIFEPDNGAADGLNKGFAAATGDVYGFLNSDDLLMPGSLQKVADFFRQFAQCDLVMGNGLVVDDKGRRLQRIRARHFSLWRYSHGGTDWLQQSTFFRRELYSCSEKFNVENRTCWDEELFTNMSNLGASVGYVDEDLSAFRIYQSSITGSGRAREQYKIDHDRIFMRYFGRRWGMTDTLWRQYYRLERLLLRTKQSVRESVMPRESIQRKECA